MKRLIAMALAALLAACSSDKPKPTPLEAITPQIAGRLAWSAKIDGAAPGLIVNSREGEFTVAAADGTVLALQADTGREIWRGNASARVSAGVGSDGRYAAVVTRDNEVVVLERDVQHSSIVSLAACRQPPLHEKALEQAASLLGSQL